MFLLQCNQVQSYQVARPTETGVAIVPGLLYQGKLFHQLEDSPYYSQEDALRAARKHFHTTGEKLALIVLEAKQQWTFWEEDPMLCLYEAISDDTKQQVVQTMNLEKLVQQLRDRSGVEVSDRFVWHKRYKRVVLGRDIVSWLSQNYLMSQALAIKIGQRLIDERHIYHVTHSPEFKDNQSLYRFYADELCK